MKKILCSLMLLAALCLLTACGGHQHGNTRVEGAVDATCEQNGYSGDVVCGDCGEIVEKGHVISATGHRAEQRGGWEATCTAEGYEGSAYCAVCGAYLYDGNKIPALGHDYSDVQTIVEATCLQEGKQTSTCSRCGDTTGTQYIDRLPHQFVDHICSVCGWREAGEYVDGQLAYSWEELVEKELLTLDGTTVRRVSKELTGLLVVEEGYRFHPKDTESVFLTGVWLPCTFTSFSNSEYGVFENMPELREVRLFAFNGGLRTSHDHGQFENCKKLETVILPEGVTFLGDHCFEHCEALKEIVLPDSVYWIGDNAFLYCSALESVTMNGVTHIGEYAFSWTSSLKEIDLHEGIEEIGSYAFKTSALTKVVLPRSLKYCGQYAFSVCQSLTEAELHGVIHEKIVYLNGKGYTDVSKAIFDNCSGLTRVIVGDDVTAFPDGIFQHCSSLKEIAWAENGSLKDISYYAFSNTFFDDLVLPGTVETFYGVNDSHDTRHLHSIDMSACTSIVNLQNSWLDADILILPPNLESLGSAVLSSSRLVLPDSLRTAGFVGRLGLSKCNMAKVGELVWPTEFKDAENIYCSSVEKILYRGTPEQWAEVNKNKSFDSVEVVFNYTE